VIERYARPTGAIDLSHTNWKKAGINFALVAISTIIVAIITEEGFFRGWLWASLERGRRATAQHPHLDQHRVLGVGVLGMAANLIFAAALWRWWKSRTGTQAST
jgi:hypothetical protein